MTRFYKAIASFSVPIIIFVRRLKIKKESKQTIIMELPIKIYADFNNADSKGRVRLNTEGTYRDLDKMNIKLQPGIEIILDDDGGLTTSGIVLFSEEERIWVAKIDWDKLQ